MNRFQSLVRSTRFIRSTYAPLAVALLFAAIVPAQAAPIHYIIEFTQGTATPPLAPPTGSFDYDGTLALNQQFSNFVVSVPGTLFDFTAAANGFTFRTDVGLFSTSCNPGVGDTVNDAFEMLTHEPCVASVATVFGWQNTNFGGDRNIFSFRANSGTGTNAASETLQVIQRGAPTSTPDFSNDGFIATAAPTGSPVPEPASLLLLGTGLVGAGLRRWRQKRA